jgi:hypothetical protein
LQSLNQIEHITSMGPEPSIRGSISGANHRFCIPAEVRLVI